MSTGKHHGTAVMGRFQAALAEGMSVPKAAKHVGVPKGTAYTWASKIKKYGSPTKKTASKQASRKLLGTVNFETGKVTVAGSVRKAPQIQDAKSFLRSYVDLYVAEGKRPTKRDGLVIMALAELEEIE